MGFFEQLWRINRIGPIGAVEKTIEEWRLVPKLEDSAYASQYRRSKA
jgi:hypothetical protein